MLIDRDISRNELSRMANVSGSTLTKLVKCENVNIDVLIRICAALECTFDDIIELMPDNSEAEINPTKNDGK
jgi:DNA-binding Xre family transcriptional regulator